MPGSHARARTDAERAAGPYDKGLPGEIRVRLEAGNDSLDAGPGTLVRFEEKERHRVSSPEGARLLLILAPWPGPGHYRGGPERPTVQR